MAEQYSVAWVYQVLLPTRLLAQPLTVVNNAKVDTVAMTLHILPLMLLCTGAEIQGLGHVAISFLIS